MKKLKNLIILIILIEIMLIVSVVDVFASKCVNVNNKKISKICFNDICEPTKICKVNIFYKGKKAMFIPQSENVIVLYSRLSKFGSFYGINSNINPLKLDIVPLNKTIQLKTFIIDKVVISLSNITIPKTPPPVKKSEIKKKSENNKNNFNSLIVKINILYLLGTLFVFILLGLYQLRIHKLEKKYRKDIEEIDKMIEKPLIKQQESRASQTTSINFQTLKNQGNSGIINDSINNNIAKPTNLNNITKIERTQIINPSNNTLNPHLENKNQSLIQEQLPIKRNFENEVIRKAIISAKLKGLPKELIYEHLSRKYNPKKVKELLNMFY